MTEVKLIKIGGSFHFIVPVEYIKVYNLITEYKNNKKANPKYISNHIYNVDVTDDGRTITFKRARKNSDELDKIQNQKE